MTLAAAADGWGNAMTPIIVPLSDKVTELSDLVNEGASVAFALDGTSRPQRWSWVRPTAGLLVWDPDGLGRITSGRQLFGSVTWWLLILEAKPDPTLQAWLTAEVSKVVFFDRDAGSVLLPVIDAAGTTPPPLPPFTVRIEHGGATVARSERPMAVSVITRDDFASWYGASAGFAELKGDLAAVRGVDPADETWELVMEVEREGGLTDPKLTSYPDVTVRVPLRQAMQNREPKGRFR